MKNVPIILFVVLLGAGLNAWGQKPFMEGTIAYKVKLSTADNRFFDGVFIFTIKGGRIKKELKLNNGYQYVLLINSANNTYYSLQTKNGKNYAIQLTLAEIEEAQQKYNGFVHKEDKNSGKIIAGYTTYKGDVTYADGSHCEIYSTPEWYPDKGFTYDRFPEAKFLPLSYTYKDEDGSGMQFEAEKISVLPVENSVFRVPSDYKIISNNEYKQLRK